MDFSHLSVEFYIDVVENKRETAAQGRPIFDEVEKVKIRMAGDPKSIHVAPAHDQSSVRDPHTNQRMTYAELHAGPYEAFKRNIEFTGSGTPLSELTFLTASKRKELDSLNIRTAEALAGLDGTNLQRLGMGGRDLKNQAQAWLERAAGTSDYSKLSAENEELKAKMAELMAKVDGLGAPDAADTVSPSPFDDWDAESIRLWIAENGGEDPHHRCSLETLIQKADELNAALAKEKAA